VGLAPCPLPAWRIRCPRQSGRWQHRFLFASSSSAARQRRTCGLKSQAWNILLIVTDQEARLWADTFPSVLHLPGHEGLACSDGRQYGKLSVNTTPLLPFHVSVIFYRPAHRTVQKTGITCQIWVCRRSMRLASTIPTRAIMFGESSGIKTRLQGQVASVAHMQRRRIDLWRGGNHLRLRCCVRFCGFTTSTAIRTGRHMSGSFSDKVTASDTVYLAA